MLPQNRSNMLVALGSNEKHEQVSPASALQIAVTKLCAAGAEIRNRSAMYRTPALGAAAYRPRAAGHRRGYPPRSGHRAQLEHPARRPAAAARARTAGAAASADAGPGLCAGAARGCRAGLDAPGVAAHGDRPARQPAARRTGGRDTHRKRLGLGPLCPCHLGESGLNTRPHFPECRRRSASWPV